MPILRIFTCIRQHRIYQLSDTSLYQRLSRNFKDLCAPELGYGKKIIIKMKPILTQMLVPIQIDLFCVHVDYCHAFGNQYILANMFSIMVRPVSISITYLRPSLLSDGILYLYKELNVLPGQCNKCCSQKCLLCYLMSDLQQGS